MKKLGSPLVPFTCLVCFISVQVLAQAQSKVCHTRAAHFEYKGNDRKWIGTDFFDENDSLVKSSGDFLGTNFYYRDANGRLDSAMTSDEEGKTMIRNWYEGDHLVETARTFNGDLKESSTFAYNPQGDVRERILWGPTGKEKERLGYLYQYHPSGKWERKETFRTAKGKEEMVELTVQTFNDAGLVLSRTVQADGGETTFEYAYGEENQLVLCWEKSGQDWIEQKYDSQGNLTFTKTYHLNRKGEQVYDFGVYNTYNKAGRLIGRETRDPKGHLKSREEWEYSPCP